MGALLVITQSGTDCRGNSKKLCFWERNIATTAIDHKTGSVKRQAVCRKKRKNFLHAVARIGTIGVVGFHTMRL